MSQPEVEIDVLVERTKLSLYLLNLAHPKGGSKAKFLMGYGFTADDPEGLASALVQHMREHLPGKIFDPPGGLRRFIFEGETTAPNGNRMNIRTVWELSAVEELRLITVVPLTK